MRTEDWQPQIADAEVQRYIFEECGDEGIELAQFIADRQPISGVDILEAHAERKASSVRKVMYRLMEARVAEYEKDTDSKGWETFIWKLTLNEVKYVLLRRWRDEFQNLKNQLRFEEDHQFYVCKHQHRRMVFEDAMDVNFQCPVCNASMDIADTAAVRRALRERIDELAPHFAA